MTILMTHLYWWLLDLRRRHWCNWLFRNLTRKLLKLAIWKLFRFLIKEWMYRNPPTRITNGKTRLLQNKTPKISDTKVNLAFFGSKAPQTSCPCPLCSSAFLPNWSGLFSRLAQERRKRLNSWDGARKMQSYPKLQDKWWIIIENLCIFC